jgi:hypothetical protein
VSTLAHVETDKILRLGKYNIFEESIVVKLHFSLDVMLALHFMLICSEKMERHDLQQKVAFSV